MTTPLEDLKIHMGATDDFDDALLQQKLDVASDFIESIMGTSWSPTPPRVAEAIRMMAAHLVENREATIAGVSLQEVPFGVMQLLNGYRYWPGQDAA